MAGNDEPAEGAPIRIRARSAEWPPEDDLGKRLEADAAIREAFRCNRNQLLTWPSPQLVGVASLTALALNVPVVKVALQVWGESNDFPKSIAIDWLKREARASEKHLTCDVHISCMDLHPLLGLRAAPDAQPRCEQPKCCHLCGCLGNQKACYFGNLEVEVTCWSPARHMHACMRHAVMLQFFVTHV